MPKKESDKGGNKERLDILKKTKEVIASRFGTKLPDMKDTPSGVSIGTRGSSSYVSINFNLTGIVDFLKPNFDKERVLREGAIMLALLEDDGKTSGILGYMSHDTAEVLSKFRETHCDLPKRRE